jgi:nucleotide-binding universal stress UspA family protein
VEKRELRSLVERIKQGKCVLVLGPRVAVRPDDPDRRPLDELLALELLKDISASEEDVAATAGNLRRAADQYVRSQGDPFMLTTFARDFYAAIGEVTTDFHRDLAQLPFQLCISAAPDNLMAAAFRNAGKKPQESHYNFSGGKAPALSQSTEKTPIVYHLFGHHQEPSSLVLTEIDLIKFLVAIIKGVPPVPDQVRGILNDAGVSCLFIGFGFHQWYLRVLLEVMNLYKTSRGIAFEDRDFFARPDRAEVVGFFSGTRRIDFRELEWEGFARELREAYESMTPKADAAGGGGPAPSLPQGAPIAFVSYASEDREQVEALAEQLEARGIDVWQDKQDLRAGQKWSKVLRSVIEDQVNYVIVVQTAAMLQREEGVFYKEIDIARERQSTMRDDMTFLIPVTVDRCPILPALGEYHVIDITEPAGIDRLATAIQEDWKKRAARRGAEA